MPAPSERLKALLAAMKVRHRTALAVADRLLPALQIAGLVDCLVPMDDDLAAERHGMWKERSCRTMGLPEVYLESIA